MSNRLKLLQEKATRPRRTVPVLLDGEVREQIEAVEDELDRLDASEHTDKRLSTKSNAARVKDLEAERERLYLAAEESTLYVVLEGMQRTPYRALVAAHPPRVGEDGKWFPEDRGGANALTLMEPLVRACIVGYRDRPDPAAEVMPMPDTDVDRLMNFVTDHQLDRLSAAAITLSAGDDAVPLRRRRSPTTTSDAG